MHACAGQAVVRFASNKLTRQESAVKFFLCRTAFEAEVKQYTDAGNPLRQFLPLCYDVMHADDARCVEKTSHNAWICLFGCLAPALCTTFRLVHSEEGYVGRGGRTSDEHFFHIFPRN